MKSEGNNRPNKKARVLRHSLLVRNQAAQLPNLYIHAIPDNMQTQQGGFCRISPYFHADELQNVSDTEVLTLLCIYDFFLEAGKNVHTYFQNIK